MATSMGNAPHMKAWPVLLQWLCGLFVHADRNTVQPDGIHYAYCLRCGRLFGHPWNADSNFRRVDTSRHKG